MPTEPYMLLWAKSKPPYPLWKHLLDAAAVSLALRNPLTDDGWSSEQVALVVGLHDIGKADPGFQHQVPEFSPGLEQAGFPKTADARVRHERVSAKFVVKEPLACMDEFRASAVARAVVAHHGYWYEGAPWPPSDTYKKAQDAFYAMLKHALGVNALPHEAPCDLSAFGMRLAGHIVLSDWIASNEEFFTDGSLAGCDEPTSYFESAKKVAKKWIVKLRLERGEGEAKPCCIVPEPRPIQLAILNTDVPPGLVIIEAPMGEGKTEAAWILAEKWRAAGYTGMYMALPTMATSDSLYGRYRDDYLKKLGRHEDAHLVHGMAWLRDDLEPETLPVAGEPGDPGQREAAAAWFRPTRRAMLAAHGVGTVDQAMLAGMNVKFGFLRLYGLDKRVLVIDEVHAYDAYMSAIIGRLLAWCACMKIPVILLSATLSAKQRAAMLEAYGASGGDPGPKADYPLITYAESGKVARPTNAEASSTRTLKVVPKPGVDAAGTAKLAEQVVDQGGCCCVVLNTVKQAQAVYGKLKGDTPKLLFHSRFCAADRQELTKRVLTLLGKNATDRPAKFIVVATQVVEQSIDVDFDHMISEIAPMDLLLQRSGRVKRHARTKDGRLKDTGDDERGEPVLHVLVPKVETDKPPKFGPFENTVYRRYPLLRTLEITNYEHSIALPADFRTLIEATYTDVFASDASNDLKNAKVEWDDLQEDMAAQAGEFLLCEPMDDEFDPVGHDEVGDDSDDGNGWRARTRLGLDDVLVIPLKQKQVDKWKHGDLPPRLIRWLYMRSVKVPSYYWPPRAASGYDQPLLGEKRLKGVWLVPVKPTDGGWQWQGVNKDGKSYTISYDATIGLTHGGEK